MSGTLTRLPNGSTWRHVRIPLPASGGTLNGIYAATSRSAWAVGCTKSLSSTDARPVVMRWNGSSWK